METEGKDHTQGSLRSSGVSSSLAMEKTSDGANGERHAKLLSSPHSRTPSSHESTHATPPLHRRSRRTKDSPRLHPSAQKEEMVPQDSKDTRTGGGPHTHTAPPLALSAFPPLGGLPAGPPALKGLDENGGVGGGWEEDTRPVGDGVPCGTSKSGAASTHEEEDHARIMAPTAAEGVTRPPPSAMDGLSPTEITKSLRRKYAEEYVRKSAMKRKERSPPRKRKPPTKEGKEETHQSPTGFEQLLTFVQQDTTHEVPVPPPNARKKENPTGVTQRRGSPPTSPRLAPPSSSSSASSSSSPSPSSSSAPLLSTGFARFPPRAGTTGTSPTSQDEGTDSGRPPDSLPPRTAAASSAPAVYLALQRDVLEKREQPFFVGRPVERSPVRGSLSRRASRSRQDGSPALRPLTPPSAHVTGPDFSREGSEREGERPPTTAVTPSAPVTTRVGRRSFLRPAPPLDLASPIEREKEEVWGATAPPPLPTTTTTLSSASAFPLPRALLPSMGVLRRESHLPEEEMFKEPLPSGATSFPVMPSDRVPPIPTTSSSLVLPLPPPSHASSLSSSPAVVGGGGGPKAKAALPPVGCSSTGRTSKSFLTPLSALLPIPGMWEGREGEKPPRPVVDNGTADVGSNEGRHGAPHEPSQEKDDSRKESHPSRDGTSGTDSAASSSLVISEKTKKKKKKPHGKGSTKTSEERPQGTHRKEGGGHPHPKPMVKVGESRSWRWSMASVPTVYQPSTSTSKRLQESASERAESPSSTNVSTAFSVSCPHSTQDEESHHSMESRSLCMENGGAETNTHDPPCPTPADRRGDAVEPEAPNEEGTSGTRTEGEAKGKESRRPTTSGRRGSRMASTQPVHPNDKRSTTGSPLEVPVAISPSPPLSQSPRKGSVTYRFPSTTLRDAEAYMRKTPTLSLLSHFRVADESPLRPHTFPGQTPTPTASESKDGPDSGGRESGSHPMGKEDGESEWKHSITSSYSIFSHLSGSRSNSHSKRWIDDLARRESISHGHLSGEHPVGPTPHDERRADVYLSGWRSSFCTRSVSSGVSGEVYHSFREPSHPAFLPPPSSLSDTSKTTDPTPFSSAEVSPREPSTKSVFSAKSIFSNKSIFSSSTARTEEGEEEKMEDSPVTPERGQRMSKSTTPSASTRLTAFPSNPMEAAVEDTAAAERPDRGGSASPVFAERAPAPSATTGMAPQRPPEKEEEEEAPHLNESRAPSCFSSSSSGENVDSVLSTHALAPLLEKGEKEGEEPAPDARAEVPFMARENSSSRGGEGEESKGVEAEEAPPLPPAPPPPSSHDTREEEAELKTSPMTLPFEKKEVFADDLQRFMKNTKQIFTSVEHHSSSSSSSSSSSPSASPPYRKHSSSPPSKTRSPLHKNRRPTNEPHTETMKETNAEFSPKWDDSEVDDEEEEDLLLFAPEQGVFSHPLTAYAEAPGRRLRVGSSGSCPSLWSHSPTGSSVSSLETYSLPSSSTIPSEARKRSIAARESRSRRDRYRLVLMGCGILYHQFFRQAGLVAHQGEMLIAPFCVDENWFSVEVAVYGLCLTSHFCKGLEELAKEKSERDARRSLPVASPQRNGPTPHTVSSPVSTAQGRGGGGGGRMPQNTNTTIGGNTSSGMLNPSYAGKQRPPSKGGKNMFQRTTTGLTRKAVPQSSLDFLNSPVQERPPSRMPGLPRETGESVVEPNSPLLPGALFPLPDDFVWLAVMSLSSKFYGELTYTSRSLVRRLCAVHEPSTVNFVDSSARFGYSSESRLNSFRMTDSLGLTQNHRDRMKDILRKKCITAKEVKKSSNLHSQSDLLGDVDNSNSSRRNSKHFGVGISKKTLTSAFFRQRKRNGVERESNAGPSSRPSSVRGFPDSRTVSTRNGLTTASSSSLPRPPLTDEAKLSQMEWIVWRAMKYDSYVSTEEYRAMEMKAFIVGSS